MSVREVEYKDLFSGKKQIYQHLGISFYYNENTEVTVLGVIYDYNYDNHRVEGIKLAVEIRKLDTSLEYKYLIVDVSKQIFDAIKEYVR